MENMKRLDDEALQDVGGGTGKLKLDYPVEHGIVNMSDGTGKEDEATVHVPDYGPEFR